MPEFKCRRLMIKRLWKNLNFKFTLSIFSYRLTIPAAVLSDAGEFEVQAINAAGKASSTARAEVDQAPRIVQGLLPGDILEGDEHLFRVEASAPIRTGKYF